MTDIIETTEIDCPYCAEKINKMAKKCKHCHEILDQVMREIEAMKSHKKDVYISNSAASNVVLPPDYRRHAHRSKGAAFLWCVFLGWIGAHKFYLGQSGWGLLYLVFFWTGIPAIISIIEAIYLVILSREDFDRKFNFI